MHQCNGMQSPACARNLISPYDGSLFCPSRHFKVSPTRPTIVNPSRLTISREMHSIQVLWNAMQCQFHIILSWYLYVDPLSHSFHNMQCIYEFLHYHQSHPSTSITTIQDINHNHAYVAQSPSHHMITLHANISHFTSYSIEIIIT